MYGRSPNEQKGLPPLCGALLLYVKLKQQPNCHLRLSVSELLNGTRGAIFDWEQHIPLTIIKTACSNRNCPEPPKTRTSVERRAPDVEHVV